MDWSAGKIGTIYQKPAHAIGLSTPPIGCVLDLPGLPGGGNKIYERSPYGNIGTITGATWKRLPSGLWYLDFDGQDDYVSCGTDTSLNPTDAVTCEAWVNSDSIGDYDIVITKMSDNAFNNGYHLFLHGVGGMRFSINNYVTDSATIAYTETGEWHHIVGTYNKNLGSNQINIYKDGMSGTPGTYSTAIATPSRNLKIGFDSGASYWDGGIALVRIYNRALSALEIQNHYQQEKQLFGVW